MNVKVIQRMKLMRFAIATLLLAGYSANAQTATPAELKKAAKSVCNCLDKRASKAKTQQQAEALFTECMLDSAMSVFSGVMLKAGTDQAKANKLGQEIGMQLGAELLKQGCPAFTKMSMQMVGGTSKPETTVAVKTDEIAGTIEQVAEDEFLTITVKAANGREYKLYYLSYVNGSDGWLKNTATLQGKKVVVGYQEKEFYQPKAKAFVGVKEIVTLALQ